MAGGEQSPGDNSEAAVPQEISVGDDFITEYALESLQTTFEGSQRPDPDNVIELAHGDDSESR
ncbi:MULTISPECIES: hypothetical protein [Pseudonocardia]|uniref:hypothetical protein n=1 Tax=Pseudonocardia TaxID=1847 RepID=UPI0005A21691|nr:hypothetical protein [Pseudonocardia dioxanivorans]GJF05074.1 hypothetical protein PSD17_40270 [Pseudonocardia sp. D17]